jgi:hypothetical protein
LNITTLLIGSRVVIGKAMVDIGSYNRLLIGITIMEVIGRT